MPFTSPRIVFSILSAFLALTTQVAASEIDACKYLVVTDFASDPFGIAEQLRTQARADGFIVVATPNEVAAGDSLKVCVTTGSWHAAGYGGSVSLRVLDASGILIGETSARGTDWWGVSRTVRKAVEKIYKQLGYTGFNEAVYEQRIAREYPKRPTVAITEDEIKKKQQRSSLEGIWTDTENKYRLGIVPAPLGSGADFVAVVLQSNSPVWQPNEIKAELHTTASPEVFTCTYFMGDKKPGGTTLVLEHDSVLRGSIDLPKVPHELVLLRVWPTITDGATKVASEQGAKSGTGFLLTRTGLIATNWHVVSDSKHVSIAFPGWKDGINADVVVRDATNDLAVLRVTDIARLTDVCRDLPYQLKPSKGIALGQRVSTIGYPLSPLLGTNPKFSEGAIASKSGLQDDPRWFQISAAIQPGSSGSPLFDNDGNVVGVVVASLDAAKAFQLTNAIPQNVNWAIKSDYLLSLAEMLPGEPLPARVVVFSPEKAAGCVALVTAW